MAYSKPPSLIPDASTIIPVGAIIDTNWTRSSKMRQGNLLNLTACYVLADIVAWHRQFVDSDSMTGELMPPQKLFMFDRLYQEYQSWSERLGLTDRQLRSAVAFLVESGLIATEVAPLPRSDGRRGNNVLWITPCVSAITAITNPAPSVSRENETPQASHNSETPAASHENERLSGASHETKGGLSQKREILKDSVISYSKNGQESQHHKGLTGKREAMSITSEGDDDFATSFDSEDDEAEESVSAWDGEDAANAADAPLMDCHEHDLVGDLTEQGVTERVAIDLVKRHGAARVRQQLSWLPLRANVKSAAATIVTSIRDNWPAPVTATAAPAAAQNAPGTPSSPCTTTRYIPRGVLEKAQAARQEAREKAQKTLNDYRAKLSAEELGEIKERAMRSFKIIDPPGYALALKSPRSMEQNLSRYMNEFIAKKAGLTLP